MIQALIGPIANLAGTWFQNKIEKPFLAGDNEEIQLSIEKTN